MPFLRISNEFTLRVVALIFGLTLIVFMTWPLAVHPTSTTSANTQFDVAIEAGFYNVAVSDHVFPLLEKRLKSGGAPEGDPINVTLFRTSPVSSSLMYSMSYLFGGVMAMNLILFGQLFALVFITVFFIRNYVGSGWSVMPMLIILLCSQPVAQSLQYLPSTFPLWLYLSIIMIASELLTSAQTNTKFEKCLALLFFLSFFWSAYLLVFSFLILIFLVIYASLSRNLWRLKYVMVPTVLATIYYGILYLTSRSAIPTRDPSDSVLMGLHPLKLLVPGNLSVFWGTFPNKFLTETIGISSYLGDNWYLGVVVIGIIASAVFLVIFRWNRDSWNQNQRKIRFLLFLGGFIIILAIPGRMGNFPMPSSLIPRISPALRRGHLLIAPLIAISSLIVAIMCYEILKLRSRMFSSVFVVILSCLIAIDGWSVPLNNISWFQRTPRESSVLLFLRDLPRGLTMHYSTDTDDATACILQHFHGQPLVNSCTKQTSELLNSLRPYDSCTSLNHLPSTGIRYVIVDEFDLLLTVRTRIDAIKKCLEDTDDFALVRKDSKRTLWFVSNSIR